MGYYAGVANPLKTFTAGELGKVVNNNTAFSYTINFTETGILQGFLATVAVATSDISAGNITMTLTRNGSVITTQTIDLGALNATQDAAVILYENLSLLAGSEIVAGENISLALQGSAGITVSVTLNISLAAVLLLRPRSYNY